MDSGNVVVIAGSVFGSQVLVQAVQGFYNKRKVQADSASVLVDKVMSWASTLTARIEKLEAELATCEQENALLRERIVRLEAGAK